MSCEICGVNVPKNSEGLHSRYHVDVAYELSQLSDRIQVLSQEAVQILSLQTAQIPDQTQSPSALITAEQEALIRLKIAQELQSTMDGGQNRRRNPRVREEIQQAIATVVQGTQG